MMGPYGFQKENEKEDNNGPVDLLKGYLENKNTTAAEDDVDIQYDESTYRDEGDEEIEEIEESRDVISSIQDSKFMALKGRGHKNFF